jgi:hypothetical protein
MAEKGETSVAAAMCDDCGTAVGEIIGLDLKLRCITCHKKRYKPSAA